LAWIGKPILVPLTTSLYVPGTLADPENVIVDVGTGFYVEKVGEFLLFAELDADLDTEHERCYEILRGEG
jgi:hypothetical protein